MLQLVKKIYAPPMFWYLLKKGCNSQAYSNADCWLDTTEYASPYKKH